MSLNQFIDIINTLKNNNVCPKEKLENYYAYIDTLEPKNLSKIIFSDYILKNGIVKDSKQALKFYDEELEKLDYQDFEAGIRKIKNKIFAAIAQGIILQNFDFKEANSLISSFAIKLLNKVFNYNLKIYSEKYKVDLKEDILIYALGKLGGYELNFSSDVDLVFIKSETLDEELAKSFVHFFSLLLSKNTEFGFVFRIDLNLRPAGASAKIIHSVSEATNYYYRCGATWERIALLKTRYIAGSKVIFNNFMEELRPYVFKKYLDYASIEEYRTIKKLIEVGPTIKEKFNLKIGAGGIRDLEFFASVTLLIFSGRITHLQNFSLSFLEIIENLKNFKIINEPEFINIKENYIYLRDLENILQSLNNTQTYDITPELLNQLLYLKFGINYFDNTKVYFEKHNSILKYNSDLFNSFLSEEISLNTFTPSKELTLLVEKVNSSYASSDIKNKITKLLFYINELEDINKELVFSRLNLLLSKLNTKLAILLIFYENKKLIKPFINILKDGSYIYEEILKYPELIDVLILNFETDTSLYKENIKKTLFNFISNDDDINSRLEKLKLFKTFEEIKLSQDYLYGGNNENDISKKLTYTARLIISNICEFLKFEKNNFCVFAYGAMGDNSMLFGSDLDLIFICNDEDVLAFEDKIKYAKKLINLISTKGRYGYLYGVDSRLTPTSNLGPVVSSFNNFKEFYYSKSSFLDKISLWKLSYVWGEEVLAKEVLSFKYEYLKNNFQRPFLASKFNTEILELRKNFLLEYSNVKYVEGGLMDLEYIVRFYQSKNLNFSKNIFNAIKLLNIDLSNEYKILKKFEILKRLKIDNTLIINDALIKVREYFKEIYEKI